MGPYRPSGHVLSRIFRKTQAQKIPPIQNQTIIEYSYRFSEGISITVIFFVTKDWAEIYTVLKA